MEKRNEFKSEIYHEVKDLAEKAAEKFCGYEKDRYTNLTDVQSIEAKEESDLIKDADGNFFYNITSFSSPTRIFYTIGNVARAKEYSVQPLFENEEFIAAVEKHCENRKNGNYTWDEERRLKDEAFRIIFGEKFEFTIEEKKIINEELTMAI